MTVDLQNKPANFTSVYSRAVATEPHPTLARAKVPVLEHLDGTQDFFHDHAQDDTDDEDASWNVREDCISKERLSERVYPNGDRHYFCPYNDNRTTQIHRAVEGHLVPVRPAQVLWYRVREWFKRRTIVLHWQEQTQMRLYGPSGTGRLADHAAFVSEFVN